MIVKQKIIVFDFDGTITRKDTFLEFIKFSRGNYRFYKMFLIFAPILLAMKLNLYPNWKAKKKIFSCLYRNVKISQFNEWCKEFSFEIDKIVRLKAIDAILKHKNNKDKIIIISASIENWIKPWAKNLGIEIVLGTRIETNNGLITGNFLSKNCYGEEKVKRLLEIYPLRNEYELIAYGDSKGDRELILYSDKGYYNLFV
jgi:phosphatidylglycerophosphatase C